MRRIAIVVATVTLLLSSTFVGIFLLRPATTSASMPASFNLPYPTYAFGSWNGGGLPFCRWNGTSGPCGTDLAMQAGFMPEASGLLPWQGVQYADWCNNANTTTTSIPVSASGFEIYNAPFAQNFLKYQVPFMVQEPLDSYGQECPQWATDAIAYHPDLKTYTSTGATVDNTAKTFVRVDDKNFGTQIYRDLVNLYNNLHGVTTYKGQTLTDYWYGISVSSVGADGGDYPKPGSGVGVAPGFMLGNASVINFAQSSFCANSATNVTYGSCSYLKSAAKGTATSTLGHACCKTSVIYNQLLVGFHPTTSTSVGYETFTNAEFYLGITYAAYNFSQKYMSHPFVVLPSYGIHIATSQYPYPYNTTVIENLNLLDKYLVSATSDVENGGTPNGNTVIADERNCKTSYGGNTGFFLAGGADFNNAFPRYLIDEPKYIRNMMYYEALCVAHTIMMPSSLLYAPVDSDCASLCPSWSAMTAFGTVLNRMSNVGNSQFAKISYDATHKTQVAANGRILPSTNITLIGGVNKPLLAWFYTNSTSGDTASVTLSPSTYHLAANCIAMSVLTWSVTGRCSGNSLSLSVGIPPRGWNPVYVFNDTSINMSPLYTNAYLSGSIIGPTSASYTLNGPALFSSWLVLKSISPVVSVTSTTTGLIPQHSSLSMINSSIVGMHWAGNAWQSLAQSGWYYDAANSLLYIHYQQGSPVTLSVLSGQNSSTSSSSSRSTTTSTFLSSSSSSSRSSSSSTSSTSTVTRTSAVTVTTSNTAQSGVYTLTLTVPTGGGITQPAPAAYAFAANQAITVTAAPQNGWRFDYWTINGAVASSSTSLSFIMTRDTLAQAWFSLIGQPILGTPGKTASLSIIDDAAVPTQVTVDGTAYPLPASFSWATGSTHELSAGDTVTAGSLTGLFFSGWTGSVNSTRQAITITALGDMKLTAGYQVRDLVSIAYTTSAGLPVLPSNVVLRGPDGFPIAGTGSSSFWLVADAKYTLVSAEVLGVNVSPLPQWGPGFVVSQPGSLTIPLSIYPVQLKFVDLFGQPIQDASVVLTTEGGQRFTAFTGADGMAYFNTVPFGWYSAKYSYLGLSGQLSDTTPGPHFQTMTMALSYPLFTVVAAFVVAVALSWLRNKFRNRGIYAAFDGYSH